MLLDVVPKMYQNVFSIKSCHNCHIYRTSSHFELGTFPVMYAYFLLYFEITF